MQPAELPSPTLLSYTAPLWTTLHLLSNAAPYWAMGHSTELRCSLLSYPVPNKLRAAQHLNWATLHPTDGWTLLSYTVPYWTELFSSELHSTIWATFSTHTFVQFCLMPKCRSVRYRNKGTPVRYRNAAVPDWDAGCRNTDAGGIGTDSDAQLCRL